jgi:hypothetical protein
VDLKVPLDPRNEGLIIINTPYWHVRRFPPLEETQKCVSSCFTADRERATENKYEINYVDMKEACTKGEEQIVIECDNGLNPFYPDNFDGFSISFYDYEENFIELTNTMRLKASDFKPVYLGKDGQ